MILKKILSSLGFIFFFSSALQADPVSINPRPRGESMGNAGLALKGGVDSAMMNPAGLADVEEVTWDLLPILVELPFALDSMNASLDYREVADKDSSTTAQKKEAATKFFSKVANESLGARLNLNPSYTRPNMHVGFFVDARLDSQFQLGGISGNQLAEAGYTNISSGLILAGAYKFLDDQLQVGATIKPLYRLSPLKEKSQRMNVIMEGFNAGESVKDQIFGEKPFKRYAFAIGFDLGAKYKIPAFAPWVASLEPSVGITYQDIGNTRFLTDEDMPSDIPQSLSLGFAIHPKWRFIQGAFAIDLRSINQKQEFLSKIHVGAEALFWNFWALRLGLSQGYLTGGIGFDLPFFELDAYVTAQEAGDYATLGDLRTIGVRVSFSI